MLKQRSLIIFTLLLLCGFKTQAQQKTTTVALFYEKVYLHTDRDLYTQGDDVWFKAYLLNAQNNKPIAYSNNLYVELISPGLKIVAQHTLRLEGGFTNGDFKLPDTLSAGAYRLRAYTNWMRNFGDKFIFEKNISIVSALAGLSTSKAVVKPIKRLKLKFNFNGIKDTLPTGPIVRFFPESGYLINDVLSNVAFKAEDELGHSIAVSGNIMASSGRQVAKFSCDSTGMGTFIIRPDDSQQYHAELVINGKPYSFNIARPLHKGFVLSINTIPGTIVADIGCNGFTLNQSGGTDLVIVARHGGKTVYKQRITIGAKNAMVQIPDANFPEGIASITLYNEYGKPIGERLVYVHHDNAKITVTTDKPGYQPKELVTVKIKLSDTTKAHLSLSAVDAGLIPVKDGDIVSYLTLRSEIQGTIQHPERLFDTTNTKRFKQMDMLLLTQGWRSYVWQRIADSIPVIKYDVEQNISLTGYVRGVFTKKGLKGMSITMFAPKAEGQKLFSATSDSLGRFKIDDVKFYGYQFFNFTARGIKGLNADGTSKGNKNGWIQVDSLYQDKLPVYSATAEKEDRPIKADSLVARETAKRNFSFKGDNQLNTVQIKSYTNILPPIVQNIGAAEQKDYGSLAHYLLYMIPQSWEGLAGCHLDDNKIHAILCTGYGDYVRRVSVTGTYADNSRIDYRNYCDEDFLNQPMSRILKITIRSRQTIDGIVYSASAVMKPGSLDLVNTFDNTMADVTGYYKARNFFTPSYQTPSDKPDYRTTIHWEPNITTDAKGEATITFYNADPKSKIRLIVQGVNDKGVLLTAGAGYEVK